MTLGSLFDGIGGFPLGAGLCGIDTLWASEIEPSCIDITKKHFPNMQHLGSVTDINGAEIPPVDIISFGSPCQDLSVAGKQAGLDGARSGLFLEAVRIINEMREATNGRYPTYAIWENVPGAYSSHGGEDFRRVLEALTKTEIPMPASGKWAESGMVRNEYCDLAWRTLDAQYWGVPQRRKRIYLVTDFRGKRTAEILFKSESLLGYSPQSDEARKGIAAVAKSGVGAAGFAGQNSITAGGVQFYNEQSPVIRSSVIPSCLQGVVFVKGTRPHNADETQIWKQSDVANTLNSFDLGETRCNELVVKPAYCVATQQGGAEITDGNISPTLTAAAGMSGNNQPWILAQNKVYTIDRAAFNQGENALYKPRISDDGINSTIVAKGPGAVAYGVDCRNCKENEGGYSLNCTGAVLEKKASALCLNDGARIDVSDEVTGTLRAETYGHLPCVISQWIVRRLTPKECERLQGFPDDWTKQGASGKEICDSARYKALGNSIAIPCAVRVFKGIVAAD